jgi:GAF domain-containing protein
MDDMMFPGGLRPDGLPAALSAPDRLAAVRATGLLDTGPEGPFDDLARLAAAVTGCGRAFVTLVDERRSFWKSCVGVDAPQLASRQNPVRESFCYFLVGLGGAPFVIEDAAADPRTSSHLNQALLDQRGGDRFLTAVYATFRTTPSGLAGRLCTAGHPPALIRRADGHVQEVGRPGQRRHRAARPARPPVTQAGAG